MKSKILCLSGVAALLALGACTPKQASADKATCDTSSDKIYTGVLPGADVDGIRYTVLLDYDDEGTGGDYEMIQTYFQSDSAGVNDVASYVTEGDFTVSKDNQGRRYLTFDGNGAGNLYFLAETDSSITMVDASLQPSSIPGLNYTLKSVK